MPVVEQSAESEMQERAPAAVDPPQAAPATRSIEPLPPALAAHCLAASAPAALALDRGHVAVSGVRHVACEAVRKHLGPRPGGQRAVSGGPNFHGTDRLAAGSITSPRLACVAS